MKVLVTGFDPFGGETINPAYEAVKALPAEIEGHTIVTAEIPTAFGAACRSLDGLMAMHRPDLVLCVGQAGGRASITFEKVAINLDDARIPDNLGQQPVDEPVVKDGPCAYFTNLPIKAMNEAVKASGIASTISYTAGTYVCNHIFYYLMHHIEMQGGVARGGFVHVPFSEAQVVDKPHLPAMHIETITRALAVGIEAALTTGEDIHVTAGTEH